MRPVTSSNESEGIPYIKTVLVTCLLDIVSAVAGSGSEAGFPELLHATKITVNNIYTKALRRINITLKV
jgi:hypothetical protein